MNWLSVFFVTGQSDYFGFGFATILNYINFTLYKESMSAFLNFATHFVQLYYTVKKFLTN